jgi:FkbM family methyltransferase
MIKPLIKKLYNFLPFKKEFFTLIKTFWTPPQKIYKHLHFVGTINIPIDGNHSFKIRHHGYSVENDLFWSGINGEWEQYSLLIWKKLAARSEVIFDIGANTGVYSLIAKAINKDSTVFAFEPLKRVYEKLVLNNEINQFDIKCIPKAVSDSTGVALIYDSEEQHEYGASLNAGNIDKGMSKASEVETITLDSFIDSEKLSRIDLMKIDVEYHEPQVIAGFNTYIRQFKPAMLIEILSDNTGDEIGRMVDGLGYNYYTINEKTGLKKVNELKKGEGYNFLLCSPDLALELGIG